MTSGAHPTSLCVKKEKAVFLFSVLLIFLYLVFSYSFLIHSFLIRAPATPLLVHITLFFFLACVILSSFFFVAFLLLVISQPLCYTAFQKVGDLYLNFIPCHFFFLPHSPCWNQKKKLALLKKKKKETHALLSFACFCLPTYQHTCLYHRNYPPPILSPHT